MEIQDWDITLNCQDDSTNNTTLEKYNEALLGGFKKAGIVSCPGSHLEEWFTEAGFKDVHVQRFPIPLGAWPKDKHLVCIYRVKDSSPRCNADALCKSIRKHWVSGISYRRKQDSKQSRWQF